MTVTARSESPLARVSAVARKEIVDIARDRRTMLVTLVTAIVAGPVLMLLVLNLIARQSDKVRELVLPVVGIERAPALQAFLERQQLTLKPAPADYEAAIKSGELDAVLEVDIAFAEDVAQGRPDTVRLAYDRSRDRARAAIAEVEALLGRSCGLSPGHDGLAGAVVVLRVDPDADGEHRE